MNESNIVPSSSISMVTFCEPSSISDLTWSPVLTVENEYSLFDGKNDSGDWIYTALVTQETNIDIVTYKKMCITLQLICPVDKYSDRVGGMQVMTLLYQPFKTLGMYLSSSSVENSRFINVMRGIIKGVNNLQIKGYVPLNINANTLVVNEEDNQGSLLFFSATNMPRSESDWIADFKAVHTTITAYPAYKNCRGLRGVLKCMDLASNSVQRQRLLQAPYFISDWEKVHDFILRVYQASNACPEFMESLMNQPVTTNIQLTSCNKHKEVQLVWCVNKIPLKNCYEVVRFLRNCIEHLNEKWKKEVSNADKTAAMKAFYVGGRKPPSRTHEASLLMLFPELFMTDVVNNIQPGVLDMIFVRSSDSAKRNLHIKCGGVISTYLGLIIHKLIKNIQFST
ncbi:hypothetical protein V2J09_008403 [Rumex salicifolius]